jgi:Ulp1 family protease
MRRVFLPPSNANVLFNSISTADTIILPSLDNNYTTVNLMDEKISLRKEAVPLKVINVISNIVFGPASSFNKYEVRGGYPLQHMLQSLEPGQFIDDSVLNSYLLCLQACNDKMVANDASLTATLFCTINIVNFIMGLDIYSALLEEEKNIMEKINTTSTFGRIVFPFCESFHFFLIVYDLNVKAFLFFDSAGGANGLMGVYGQFEQKVNAIKTFLQANSELSSCIDAQLKDVSDLCGKQENGCDCGMFCIMFADFIADSIDVCRVLQEDIPTYRRKVQSDLIHRNVRQSYLTSDERPAPVLL